MRAVAVIGALSLVAAACRDSEQRRTAPPVSAVSARTPRLSLPRFETGGSYLRFRSRTLDLRPVDAALRRAVVTDQRAFMAEASTKHRRRNPYGPYDGVYFTEINRDLEALCAKVAQEQPRLPDGRSLLFRMQGAAVIPLLYASSE